MGKIRGIEVHKSSTPTVEGAGVRLRRAFGFREAPGFDPFLLLDDFRGDDPTLYSAGFPWHPHRGIETITYMLKGRMEHSDSLGNRGVIGPGEVQWMTAGSGIIHQEMPKGDDAGGMGGFQLWTNLPRGHKMRAPRYREIGAAEICKATSVDGICLKVIAGEIMGAVGPVRDVISAPLLVDVTVVPGVAVSIPVARELRAFAYVFEGRAELGSASALATVIDGSLVRFGPGDEIAVRTFEQGVRFLLGAARPWNEPVAWRGPIVMNTQEELDAAFEQYRAGSFIMQA